MILLFSGATGFNNLCKRQATNNINGMILFRLLTAGEHTKRGKVAVTEVINRSRDPG